MTEVPLADLSVVDNHCHPVDPATVETTDPARWRRLFTESAGPEVPDRDVPQTAAYRRLMARTAAHLGVAASEEAVLAARRHLGTAPLTRQLFADAGIGAVVVDGGYPAVPGALEAAGLAALTGCGAVRLLRLETTFATLVAEHATLDALLDAVDALAGALRADGWAGLKSIAGYRTGLDIRRWDRHDVGTAFDAARREVAERGSVRLGHRPLLEHLLHVSFRHAAAQELPVQFHCGYGDPDVDLRAATPLHLRSVLEDPAYRAMPVVLLHGCWPYTREGAFLAAVYPNAYLDVSYGIPFLSLGELRAVTRAALGAAPWSKLMYSSDGSAAPELHWIGAHDGRSCLARALGELVDDGELAGPDEARDVAARILSGTASQLYGVAVSR